MAGLRVMSINDFSKNEFFLTSETRETGKTARMDVHSGVSSIALVLFLGNLFLLDALRSVLIEFLVLLHDLALTALALSTTSGAVGVTVSIYPFSYASQFIFFFSGQDLRQLDIDSSRFRHAILKHGVVELVQAGPLMRGR